MLTWYFVNDVCDLDWVWRDNCITLWNSYSWCLINARLLFAQSHQKSECSMLTWEWVLMSLETHVIPDQITSHPPALFWTKYFFTFSFCLKMLPCCALHTTNDLTSAPVTSLGVCCQRESVNVEKAKSPKKSWPLNSNQCFNFKQNDTADILQFHGTDVVLCISKKVAMKIQCTV